MSDIIFKAIDKLVYDFLISDRENDPDLPIGSIDDSVHFMLTVNDIVVRFRSQLEKQLSLNLDIKKRHAAKKMIETDGNCDDIYCCECPCYHVNCDNKKVKIRTLKEFVNKK